MIHLLPLPGSPQFGQSIAHVLETAVEDARTLEQAGFRAAMVENFGDTPFYPDQVPPETVAAMTAAVQIVTSNSNLAVGINVLRNDALSALAVAAATRAAFVRVNVLAGMMYTDQGPIVGRAAEVQRTRSRLCPEVQIWADVMVKHATPPQGTDPARNAIDTVERAGADAVIVSGTGTGSEPDIDTALVIRNAIGSEHRLVIGSGARPDNLAELTKVADSVIVGSSLKFEGRAGNRVDPRRAEKFIAAARSTSLL